jgi:hypothetical protein
VSDEPAQETLSVATDLRARQSVRRIRAACGLLAFAAAAIGATNAGLPFALVVERALGAGITALLVGWWAAVTAYRHLIRARVRAAVLRAQERR